MRRSVGRVPLTVAPTLASMAGVYRLPATGGRSSPRFHAYTEAAEQLVPVHGYNPMTTKAVLPTVEALLAIDAEARLATVAAPVLGRLGVDGDVEMHLTVATPGMWTDQLATEIEHRLLGHDPHAVLWWFDQLVTEAGFDAAVVAQAVRLARFLDSGPPATLAAAASQEGAALAAAGATGRLDPAAAEVLDVLAGDPTLSTMVGFLHGDVTAEAMGYTPLGLGDQVGQDHAVAAARAAASG